jgi:hypothetical protein
MWAQSNAARRKYQQHTPWDWLLERASRAPMAWVLSAMFLAFAGMAVTAFWLEPPYPGVVDFGPTNKCGAAVGTTSATSNDQLKPCYSAAGPLAALLSVQASFIAVVYPIVVAFITILIQRQTASKASLSAYLAASSATLTGLSGFGLVAVAAVQLVLVDEVAPATGFAWLCADLLWLLQNLTLSARFLLRTFKFATPEGRRGARDEHVLRVVWPMEASYHLARGLVLEPLKHRLHSLPDAAALSMTDSSAGFSDVPRRFGREPFFLPTFRGKKHVVDVHYGILELAFRLWSKRASKPSVPLPGETNRHPGRVGPTLEIAVHLHQVISHLDPVFRQTNANAPDRLTGFLLRKSLSLSRSSKAPAAKVMDALEEAREDVAAAMQKGSSAEVLRTLDELTDFTDEVVKCSQFKATAELENLVLLPDSDGTSNEPLIVTWLRVIEDLFVLALTSVNSTSFFAERFVRVPLGRMSRQHATMPSELRVVYIELQFSLLKRLLEWAAEHCATAPASERLQGSMEEPTASRYEKVLGQGLGAVEHVLRFNLRLNERAQNSWPEVQLALPHQQLHLRRTAELVVLSARGQDRIGAVFALNCLLHWRDMAASRTAERHQWSDALWVTFMHVPLPLADVKAEFAQAFGTDAGQADVVGIGRAILSNLWRDVCTLVVAILISQVGRDAGRQMLAAKLAKAALLHNRDGDMHDLDEQERIVHSADQLLHCMVRQQVIDAERENGYSEFLDKLVKELTPSPLDKGIRGRARAFYMPGVESLRDEFLLMLALLAPGEWRPERRMERYLRRCADDVAQRNQLGYLLQACLDRLETESPSTQWDAMWRLLRPDDADGLGEALGRVAAGLKSLQNSKDNIFAAALRQQPVSNVTVQRIASQVSDMVRETGRYAPLDFFHSRTSAQLGESQAGRRTLRVRGWDKGILTDPPMSDFGGSDIALLKDLVSHAMASETMKDLASQPGAEHVNVDSSTEFERTVVSYGVGCRAQGETPVLLVQSGATPPWLLDLSVPRLHAGSEVVTLRRLPSAEGEAGYIGHIGETGIYEVPLPADQGILCAKEKFVELAVESQNGSALQIEPQQEEDEDTYSLNLTWQQRVQFSDTRVVRLQFPPEVVNATDG